MYICTDIGHGRTLAGGLSKLGNAAFSGVFVIFSHHYGCVVPISCVVLVGNLYSVTIAKFFLAPFYTPDDLKQLKQTVFGRDRYVMENGERILAYDENITPEQEAILRGHNFREYPTIQELSEGKDSNSSSNFQANAEENSSADAKNSKQTSFSLAPDKERKPAFYSNAQKAVEKISQKKATGDQWLAMIQKQGGLSCKRVN